VEAHSAAGEHTGKRLMLNDDDSLKYREFLLGLIALAEEKARSVRETLSRLERKSSNTPEQSEDLQKETQSCIRQLEEIERYLALLTGGDS
jgi:hypothetical protein